MVGYSFLARFFRPDSGLRIYGAGLLLLFLLFGRQPFLPNCLLLARAFAMLAAVRLARARARFFLFFLAPFIVGRWPHLVRFESVSFPCLPNAF